MQLHPSVFFNEEHAQQYDTRYVKMAPIRELLHFVTDASLAGLPEEARVLIVGAGTGLELQYLAAKHPGWRFVAVEPSEPMLRQLQSRCCDAGLTERCTLFHGFIEELPAGELFDGATSLLVSQFLLKPKDRCSFFRGIAERLKLEAPLLIADLSADLKAPEGEAIVDRWFEAMSDSQVVPEQLEILRQGLLQYVSIIAPRRLEALIESAGFGAPLQLAQALLIRAWVTIRIEP